MKQFAPNVALVYSVKKDGSLYKHPEFHRLYGDEKTAEDIVARLERLNPGHKFVAVHGSEVYKSHR